MNIFAYDDYRAYLKDFWLEKKTANPGLAARNWAKNLGVDHTLFHKILKNERHLPMEKITPVVEGLNLSSSEADYFQLLIDYSQCGSRKLKEFIRQEMILLKNQAVVHKMTPEEFRKLDFYDMVLMEMTEIHEVDFSPTSLSRKLNLSPGSILERLSRLVLDGFLTKDGDIYAKAIAKMNFKINFSQDEISTFFKEVNSQSSRHVDYGSPQKRAFRVRIVSIAKENGPVFAKMLDRFMQQVEEAFKEKESKDITVCINMQLFPLWEES